MELLSNNLLDKHYWWDYDTKPPSNLKALKLSNEKTFGLESLLINGGDPSAFMYLIRDKIQRTIRNDNNKK